MGGGANDWVRGLLRTLVLKTNPHFPFRYCNRWPYDLALKSVIAAVRSYPEVRAVYLRRGLAPRVWIPGLSDIDLSLILERGLSAEREFDLVDALHWRYRRLRQWFPMLGELEILGADDLNAWLGATCRTPVPRSWTLLYGTPALDAAFDRSPDWRSQALNFALWIYLDVLPPCLAEPDSYLRRQDVLRRVGKIVRVLSPILAENGKKEPPVDSRILVPDLVACAAKVLETAVKRVDAGTEAGGDATSSRPARGNSCQLDSVGQPKLAREESAVAFPDKVIVLLKNGLAVEEIAGAVAANQRALPSLPLAERVFGYMVRKYNPYDYAELTSDCEISLARLPAPGRADFADFLLSRFGHVLAFTRGAELFPASDLTPVPALESQFSRLMAIHLLVDKGWLASDRKEIGPKWRREFPERAQDLDRINLAATHGSRAARREAFDLFRSLANEVRDAVTRQRYE
jgi:hypothetical protein